MKILKKIFGSSNSRRIRKMNRVVKLINELEIPLQSLTNEQLKNKTNEYKERYQKGETLDQLLPEAFALVREASKRINNERHFDV